MSKAVTLAIDMNHSHNFTSQWSLICQEIFTGAASHQRGNFAATVLLNLVEKSRNYIQANIFIFSYWQGPTHESMNPQAYKQMNPVAPNMPFRLLIRTPQLYPHPGHNPPGQTDYLSDPSAASEKEISLKEISLSAKSGLKSSRNPTCLHWG